MKISVKCDYALRAMLELALEYGVQTSNIHEVARRQGIPKRYLEHLLLTLKRSGLVVSFRGKEGGYKLAKKPKLIKLGDIIRAIEGDLDITPKVKAVLKKGTISDVWLSIQGAVVGVLDSITLEDLVNKKRLSEKTLTYYI
ncbi:MAG: Rrf2 family transcriptional regulator [Candidatus Margulisbacteria bacterium]|nr:Rrf2 family transcriptional regulator [Candidatus Margulisiibacteriota bacterium]